MDRFLTPPKIRGCQEPVQGAQEPDPPQNLGGQEPVQGGQEPDPLKIWMVRNSSRVDRNLSTPGILLPPEQGLFIYNESRVHILVNELKTKCENIVAKTTSYFIFNH